LQNVFLSPDGKPCWNLATVANSSLKEKVTGLILKRPDFFSQKKWECGGFEASYNKNSSVLSAMASLLASSWPLRHTNTFRKIYCATIYCEQKHGDIISIGKFKKNG